MEAARKHYGPHLKNDRDRRSFDERAPRALRWLELHAPPEFKFSLNETPPRIEGDATRERFLARLRDTLDRDWDRFATDSDLHGRIHELIREEGLGPAEAFSLLYQLLISQDRGPKLAGFIRTIGRERVLRILDARREVEA